ncbi:hypothetical protein QTP70_028796, partial [Hemibagrus guttatus]
VRDLKWTVGELDQVIETTPSSMTKVYRIVVFFLKHITGDDSESPRSQPSPLPPEKSVSIQHCGRKKQSTKAQDEGDTQKHESQVSPCGGQQAENSFFKKLKNVKEHFKGMKVRDLKWTVGELDQVIETTPSSMTKVYRIVVFFLKHITGDDSESPRSQPSPLPPEKSVSIQHCGRKKQSTKAQDEGDTQKHESQVSPCGGQQAENSFFKKLKNVKEHFKGMKLNERCRRATSSISPIDLKEHMQKFSHYLRAGSDVDYRLLEEHDCYLEAFSQ